MYSFYAPTAIWASKNGPMLPTPLKISKSRVINFEYLNRPKWLTYFHCLNQGEGSRMKRKHSFVFFSQSQCISISPHYVYLYIQPYFKNINDIKFELVFLDNKSLNSFIDHNALKLVFSFLFTVDITS
jgi:hypothetical protein